MEVNDTHVRPSRDATATVTAKVFIDGQFVVRRLARTSRDECYCSRDEMKRERLDQEEEK